MTKPTLRERVAALEQQVAELRELVAGLPREGDWQRTVGMFTGDEVMKRIDEAALRYREKDRERARRRVARKLRRKKED